MNLFLKSFECNDKAFCLILGEVRERPVPTPQAVPSTSSEVKKEKCSEYSSLMFNIIAPTVEHKNHIFSKIPSRADFIEQLFYSPLNQKICCTCKYLLSNT